MKLIILHELAHKAVTSILRTAPKEFRQFEGTMGPRVEKKIILDDLSASNIIKSKPIERYDDSNYGEISFRNDFAGNHMEMMCEISDEYYSCTGLSKNVVKFIATSICFQDDIDLNVLDNLSAAMKLAEQLGDLDYDTRSKIIGHMIYPSLISPWSPTFSAISLIFELNDKEKVRLAYNKAGSSLDDANNEEKTNIYKIRNCLKKILVK